MTKLIIAVIILALSFTAGYYAGSLEATRIVERNQ
jgi:hypothetical protein